MPTTRRSTGGAKARTGPTKGQSTLSFHNKVTKNVQNDAKKAIVSPSAAKVELPSKEEVTQEEVKEEVEPDTQEDVNEEEEIEELLVPEKSEAELRAEKITDAQIDKYWKSVEKQRIAPRVHQEGVPLNEKVLRYFDVSSQYGVSTQ